MDGVPHHIAGHQQHETAMAVIGSQGGVLFTRRPNSVIRTTLSLEWNSTRSRSVGSTIL